MSSLPSNLYCETVAAYIGLGSNLGDPVAQINVARSAIAALPGVEEINFSHLYASPPMGPADQPDYVNAVMRIETDCPVDELLQQLQTIENAQGRIRLQHWGARTLDLDILLYGNRVIETENLQIPHIGLAERAFVLYPLSDVAEPDLPIPGHGRLSDLLAKCPLNGLRCID